MFALVGIGLSWAVSDYAAAVGTLRAKQTVALLQEEPHATLYSERSLDLTGLGVSEVRCTGTDAVYEFRYDGLVLVLQSGGQYLLVPRQWTPGEAPAAVVPERWFDPSGVHMVPTGAGRAALLTATHYPVTVADSGICGR